MAENSIIFLTGKVIILEVAFTLGRWLGWVSPRGEGMALQQLSVPGQFILGRPLATAPEPRPHPTRELLVPAPVTASKGSKSQTCVELQ